MRIWWVRPVSSRTRTWVATPKRCTTSQWVTAGLPRSFGPRHPAAAMGAVADQVLAKRPALAPETRLRRARRRSAPWCGLRAASAAPRARACWSAKATSPELSLSSRCTTETKVRPPALPRQRLRDARQEGVLLALGRRLGQEAGRLHRHDDVAVECSELDLRPLDGPLDLAVADPSTSLASGAT